MTHADSTEEKLFMLHINGITPCPPHTFMENIIVIWTERNEYTLWEAERRLNKEYYWLK